MKTNRLALLLALIVLAPLSARAADALKYEFKGEAHPAYLVIIRAELPDAVETRTGIVAFDIKSVDPANGQIHLSCASQFNTDRQPNRGGAAAAQPGGAPANLPNLPNASGGSEVVLSPQGDVVRTDGKGGGGQIPYLLGDAAPLLLPPLDAGGAATWTTRRDIEIENRQENRRWPPPPPWDRGPVVTSTQKAHDTITYAAGAPENGLVPIKRDESLATDEMVGGNPALKITGSGTVQFDPAAGMVRSFERSYTIESNHNNATLRVPITLSARLLTADELTAAKAKQEVAAAAMQARFKKMDDDREAQTAGMDGAVKSEQIGGTGGGPFARVDGEQRPVIGIRYKLGDWGGHHIMRELDPLYEKPTEPAKDDFKDIMARPGYAVSGLVVNYNKENNDLYAIQIGFAPLKDGKLAKVGAYRTPWLGQYDRKAANKVLVTKDGQPAIGFFGRQGLNTDAIGLLWKDPSAPAAEATPDPGAALGAAPGADSGE